MMIVQADQMSAPASRERAQRLYDKNIELENKRRKSAQARIPSDPNAWQIMRENYEAIVLEDHAFSEQHNIEYALWQLHYKRIEELRAHFSAASQVSNTSKGVKGPQRPDRLTKIRTQLKTFLSEATGFYHDLILKIRAKYGLPLGYSSEDSESQIVTEKDGKKSADMKKGLISCHRCLIYLGDLARYKGLYGEGDSKVREHTAASSYYLQAASLWPSSGNPHHQLAILASYAGEELVAIYRYFRSLALESPFSTARDNLIVAFEKNRQSYSQLPGDVKSTAAKEFPSRSTGRGRGRVDIKIPSKNTNSEASPVKEKVSSIHEMYKVFCIRFVRLNGILFTRTSLETFSEVLSLANSGLCELLSSGPEEELNLGANAVENGLLAVRLVAILIFTVHNVTKETDGQTYAEILQRAVLVQNAFTAVFEIMGHILERCVQLSDPSSSYLLPGILVFVEWLACCPDVATGSDAEEKQATPRLKFWNHCISFLNKLLSTGPVSMDDDADDSCFYNMSRYDEGQTENRLALWEDFELRGFLPILPAQTVLDFSRKHSFGSDGSKERKARVKRILAAGKALVNVVRLDKKTICFDPKVKKFILGVEPAILDDIVLTSYTSVPSTDRVLLENQAEKPTNSGVVMRSLPLHMEGEDDDEVIVFKPAVAEKQSVVIGLKAPYEGLEQSHSSAGGQSFFVNSVSAPLDSVNQLSAFDGNAQTLVAGGGNIVPQVQSHVPKWLVDEEDSLTNSLKAIRFFENGHVKKPEVQGDMGIFQPAAFSFPRNESVNNNVSGMFQSLTKAPQAVIPAKIGAVATSGFDSLAIKAPSALPSSMRKNPVSRPVRRFGPPPGFSPVPPKQVNAPSYGSDLTGENPLVDDYSWLDGYQLPSATKSTDINTSINYPPYANSQYVSNSNELTGTASFPFPGKHVPGLQFHMEKQNGWQNYQPPENLRPRHEPQLQQHQFINGNQQLTPLPEQYHGQSVWTGHYIV